MFNDSHTDDDLIRTSPFIKGDAGYYHFKATDPVSGRCLEECVNFAALLRELLATDYHTSEEFPSFAGILTCSCGDPGCAGLWEQSFQMSDKWVHWSVLKYKCRFDFYFDREAYEMGMIQMFHDMVANPQFFDTAEKFGHYELDSLKLALAARFNKRPYFWDMWEKACGDEFIDLRDVDEEKNVAEECDAGGEKGAFSLEAVWPEDNSSS